MDVNSLHLFGGQLIDPNEQRISLVSEDRYLPMCVPLLRLRLLGLKSHMAR